VRIQYKCLVPIYAFPEMKLSFPKQNYNYNVLSPSSYTQMSLRDLYISRIGLPILLQENMWTDPGNIKIVHRHLNCAAQFPANEYINGIYVAVYSIVIACGNIHTLFWLFFNLLMNTKLLDCLQGIFSSPSILRLSGRES
jgi:hypothetical protein